MEYGPVIFGEFPMKHIQKLNVVQNNALRSILRARQTSPISFLEVEAYFTPLEVKFGYLFIKCHTKMMYTPNGSIDSNIVNETGIFTNKINNNNYR